MKLFDSFNNVLWNFLIVGTKLRFLFRSLYTPFVKCLLCKLTTFPAGSNWSPAEFLIIMSELVSEVDYYDQADVFFLATGNHRGCDYICLNCLR